MAALARCFTSTLRPLGTAEDRSFSMTRGASQFLRLFATSIPWGPPRTVLRETKRGTTGSVYKKKTSSNIQLPDVFRRGEKLLLFFYRPEAWGDFSPHGPLRPSFIVRDMVVKVPIIYLNFAKFSVSAAKKGSWARRGGCRGDRP
jgi:hypothetical protein